MKNVFSFPGGKKGIISYLGLLIALLIIAWLTIKMFNTYYKKSPQPTMANQGVSGFMEEQNIDTSDQGAILDSVKVKLANIQNTAAQRSEEAQQY
jgi:hypothetical protein